MPDELNVHERAEIDRAVQAGRVSRIPRGTYTVDYVERKGGACGYRIVSPGVPETEAPVVRAKRVRAIPALPPSEREAREAERRAKISQTTKARHAPVTEQYRALVARGLTVAEIAAEMGRAPSTVRTRLAELKLKAAPAIGRPRDDALVAHYRALVERGCTARQIATEIGVTYGTARANCERWGLKPARERA